MALSVPTGEPSRVVKGTRWTWKKFFFEFPQTDGWSLEYRFHSPLHDFVESPAAYGGGWLFELEPAATTDIPAAEYQWQARVSHASDGEFVADQGVLLVDHDLGAVAPGEDTRTFARRMLDAIEARLLGTADRDDLSYSTEGLSVSRYSPEQLEERRSFYKRIVNNEERARRARNGEYHGGRIFSRLP